MNARNFALLLFSIFFVSSAAPAQIQAGKAVQIMIQGVPAEEKGRIDGIYPVSESGYINMPFINQVRASGLRNEDLAVAIQQRYKSEGIYNNPTVQVISSQESGSVNQQVVYLGGQVRKTGPVPFVQGLTLYQAVQAGGGPTEFGSIKRVKLFRGGNQKLYDLTQSQFMRIPLEPNDTIEVPQKNIFSQ